MSEGSETKSSTERPKCSYQVKRKGRNCKMYAMVGHPFCAEHGIENLGESGVRKRIHCPLDPKHTTFEHKLESHLRKCNANKTDRQSFEIVRLNCADLVEEVTITSLQCEETITVIKKLLTIYTENQLGSLIIDESAQCNQHLQSVIEDSGNKLLGDKKRHHLQQTGSLIYQLEKHSALKKDINFVELGAGKGGVAYWLKECLLNIEAEANLSNTNIVLVDMASHRHKMDSRQSESLYPQFTRLRVNLEDLALNRVSILKENTNPVVAVSKHLCGDATDLSLRCLKSFIQSDENYETASHLSENSASRKSSSSNLLCVVIALCCHHRCTWSQFVGREHFQKLGLTARDFAFIRAMSSWATCSFKSGADCNTTGKDIEEFPAMNKEDVDSIEKFDDLSINKKEFIGLACKRILDWCRVNYVKSEFNYSAELCKYVTKVSSLENIALVAYQKSS